MGKVWTPRHTKEELNDAAIAAQSGGERERDLLARMMRPYVVKLAYTYSSRGDYTYEQGQELTQSAWLGVWIALPKFDPGMGTKFSTYAHYWMRTEIQQWMARNSRALPLSRRQWINSMRLQAAFEELYPDRLIENASDDELAALTIGDYDSLDKMVTIPHAGDIMRAKRASVEIDVNMTENSAASAESDFFDEEFDQDADALAAIALMRSAKTDANQFNIAMRFCDRYGHGTDVAERMMEAMK